MKKHNPSVEFDEDVPAADAESCEGGDEVDGSGVGEAGTGEIGSELALVLGAKGGSGLSAAQCKALEQLTGGRAIGEAASAAGVSRMTLYRWMHQDAEFQAAYNAWQRDTAAAGRAALLALTGAAVRALGMALEKGDAKSALVLLKSMGILKPAEPGSTNVEDVKKEQKIERKREDTRLFIEELEAGFPK